MNLSFFSACKEILAGAAPWFVVVVLLAWVACRRSIDLKLTIGDSKAASKDINDQ